MRTQRSTLRPLIRPLPLARVRPSPSSTSADASAYGVAPVEVAPITVPLPDGRVKLRAALAQSSHTPPAKHQGG
jgi:hypothetical protein